MISLTDLLPTVLDAAGAPSPQGIDGKSFLPVLTGDRDSFRDLVFASHTGDKNFNRSPMRAIRTDRWKLIRSEKHTSELQSLMRISYAVFCLNKKKTKDYHCLLRNINKRHP